MENITLSLIYIVVIMLIFVQGCAILIGIELVIEMIIENSPIFRYRIDIESVFGISYYRY